MLITFSSGKGGVGKTSGALAVAASLAHRHTVALVDLDPDAYGTTMGLGQPAHPQPLAASAVPIIHPQLVGGQLILYPGGQTIDGASQAAIAAHLDRCAATVDIVVVDTPPDRRRPTVLAALRAATLVVIPILPEFQALAGLEKLIESHRTIGAAAPVRALLSRWEPRTLLAQDVQRELVTTYPGLALSATIPRDQRAAEAPATGLPVTLSAPRSPSAIAYRTAAVEIAALAGIPYPKEVL